MKPKAFLMYFGIYATIALVVLVLAILLNSIVLFDMSLGLSVIIASLIFFTLIVVFWIKFRDDKESSMDDRYSE